MKKFYTLLLALLCVADLSAKDYYCMPQGKGDGSSYDNAGEFTSLVKNLKAGDVLYCRGGQYDYSSTISIGVSGNSSNMVCIFACQGETPIFDFRNINYGSRGINTSGDYLHMRGLTIRYSGKNGLLNSGSYCIFELLDVYGHGDTGVQMKGGHNNLILNCDSHDNFDYQLSGISAADFGGNADGFADKQYTGGGNTYRGCRAWNNSDDGWDFYQHVSGGYGPTIIENCICYANGPGEYNMVGHARYNKDKSWFDQFKGEGIDITDNDGNYPCHVSLEHYTNWGNANGFKLGGGQTKHDVIVRNCYSVANGKTCTQGESKGAKAFDQNNNGGEMWIYNNTAYDNPRNFGFSQTACGTGHFYNNVSYCGDMPDIFTLPVHDEQYNTWNISDKSVSDADFKSLDMGLILVERNADGSLAENDFLRLAEGSWLIDAGTSNTGLTFYGAAPDLGCFEVKKGEVHAAVTMDVEGALDQSLKVGRTMATVKVTAGGGAEGIALKEPVNVPGIDVKIAGKVATISGTPTEAGVYTISLVPVVDYDTKQSVTLTLHVAEASAVTVGYVTTGGGSNAADKLIVEAIAKNFEVVFFDATSSSNNYGDCDAIVISPVPSSSASAMKSLKNYNLPTLLLKPWMMKSGVWDWGTAVNTTDLSVKVVAPEHEIFKYINLDADNVLKLFTAVSNSAAVTAVSSQTSWNGHQTLATPVSNSSNVTIADFTGATLNGSKVNNRYIMLGISEYSTANLTPEAQHLISNACHYILGKEIPSTAIKNINAVQNTSAIYDITGRRIATPTHGIYIINGKKYVK